MSGDYGVFRGDRYLFFVVVGSEALWGPVMILIIIFSLRLSTVSSHKAF